LTYQIIYSYFHISWTQNLYSLRCIRDLGSCVLWRGFAIERDCNFLLYKILQFE